MFKAGGDCSVRCNTRGSTQAETKLPLKLNCSRQTSLLVSISVLEEISRSQYLDTATYVIVESICRSLVLYSIDSISTYFEPNLCNFTETTHVNLFHNIMPNIDLKKMFSGILDN